MTPRIYKEKGEGFILVLEAPNGAEVHIDIGKEFAPYAMSALIHASKDNPSSIPEWLPQRPHYVVATEFDYFEKDVANRFTCDRYGIPVPVNEYASLPAPIAGETQLLEASTLGGALARKASLGDRYGRSAIARLVFQEPSK